MNETGEDLWQWSLHPPPKVLIHYQTHWLSFVTRKRENHFGGYRYCRKIFIVNDHRLPRPIFPFYPLACNKGGVVVMFGIKLHTADEGLHVRLCNRIQDLVFIDAPGPPEDIDRQFHPCILKADDLGPLFL